MKTELSKKFKLDIAGKEVTFETGALCGQSNGTCLVTCGETVIMVNVTMSDEPKPGIDFFPLSVEYQEKRSIADYNYLSLFHQFRSSRRNSRCCLALDTCRNGASPGKCGDSHYFAFVFIGLFQCDKRSNPSPFWNWSRHFRKLYDDRSRAAWILPFS